MASVIYKSKFPGIRYRENDTRKNGLRKDKYYFLRYKINNKDVEEGFGWESEGFTEKGAYEILCSIKQNIKTGTGYFSLKEKREHEQSIRHKEAEQNTTLSAFFDGLFTTNHLADKTAKTKYNQTTLFDKHIRSEIGHKYLKDITRLDIENIKAKLRGNEKDETKKYAAATVNYIMGMLKNIFNRAEDFGKFSGKNPAEDISELKKDNRRYRFLTEEEAEILLKELKGMIQLSKQDFAYDYYHEFKTSQLYEMALLSLYCGLRGGELRDLMCFDINFATRQIAIRDPKNTINRFVPMPQIIYETLKQRIDNIRDLTPNNYLFRTRTGKHMLEISDQYARIVERLGFNENVTDPRQKVVFHTLRHTFASWLVQRGIDKYIVQKLLGHSKGEMTERYAHLAPDNFSQAIQALDRSNNY